MQTHIEVKPNGSGGHSLKINGVELSDRVTTDGFNIQPLTPGTWRCEVTFIADSVDVDVPGWVVDARSDGTADMMLTVAGDVPC